MALRSIRIPDQTDLKLKEISSISGRSSNALIAEAVSKFLRQFDFLIAGRLEA